VTMSSIQVGDVPTLNQNTTGTAANITATTNTTLTTLSSLSLPGTQVTGNISGNAANVTGTVAIGHGGTGQTTAQLAFDALSPLSTTGDTLYFDGTHNTNLGIGSTGQVLTVVSGLPAWATPATSGTVTSVALLDGSTSPIYNISGSPVTSTGTLDFTLKTQSANTVFSGPSTGSAAQPSFRSLVIGDLSFAGSASGVATLDGSGKVPLSQLPATLMEFKGSWNPNTNTPTLVDGTGTTGFTYWVSAADAGPVSGLNDPSMTNFQLGDLVIYNGTAWVLVTPAAGVQSVNGAQGAVVMSMATANGFAGTYSGTALTVSTTITGLLKGNGTAISAASAGTDYVIPSGSITGTASNITATSNSTLTTLTALSLPTSQLSGNISLTTQVSGILPIANGGTGQSSASAAFNALAPATSTGGLIVGSGTNTYGNLVIGSTGQVLTVSGGTATWSAPAATTQTTEDIDTLSSGDITSQFVDLAFAAQGVDATHNSVSLDVVDGPEQLKGVDYTVSLTGGIGGVTRITFAGDLATGGNAALVAGDILMIKYAH